MASSTRPGDLLAGRYRLIDLLSEAGGGRFWRAHDRVLERYVALHVIAEDDPRAPGLIDAARASATVLDPRILRVLDAETRDGRCYVVNEWGTGTSLDLLLANNGPLGPRRAAWLVTDIAGAIQRAHDAGVAHGRLNPENVLIDRFGAVRLIGFCVDAALHGLPGGRFQVDLGDLGGLLYAALTGVWPGPSTSDVPPAPRSGDEVLSPRQVRAGVPTQLDDVWRAIVETSDPSVRRRHWVRRLAVAPSDLDVSTADAIARALLDFIGDPSGMPAALAATVLPINQVTPVDLPAVSDPVVHDVDPDPEDADPDPETVLEEPPVVEPPVVEPPVVEPPVVEEVAQQPSRDHPDDTTDDTDTADSLDSIPLVTELPTEPGLPVFAEDGDVEWLRTRANPPPPPPPFEDPPERPLFAPDPPEGPSRRPRYDDGDPHHPLDRQYPTGETIGFWPWDHDAELQRSEPEETGVPGRSWLRLAMGALAALLLIVAVAIAFNLGRGRTPLGAEPDDPTPSASATAGSTTLTGVRAAAFDPLGQSHDEHDSQAAHAVDGDPHTSWPTSTYDQQLGPDGLKTGVGMLLDLGRARTVTDVELHFVGRPTSVSLYVLDDAPDPGAGAAAVPTGAPLAKGTADANALTLAPPADDPVAATGRYVLVWLTALPPSPDGGFRGEIAEVVVHGH